MEIQETQINSGHLSPLCAENAGSLYPAVLVILHEVGMRFPLLGKNQLPSQDTIDISALPPLQSICCGPAAGCQLPSTHGTLHSGRQKDRHSLQGSLAWLPLRALLCSMMAIANVLSPDSALYCPPLINVCPWPKASLVYLILGANICFLKKKRMSL